MRISLHTELWPAIAPVRITGQTFHTFSSLIVELEDDGVRGRGEARGVYYLDETPESMAAQVESVIAKMTGADLRSKLQSLLPPGGARNALDCALWDMAAKRSGKRVWQLAGITPKRLQTVFTIGIEPTTGEMAARAAEASGHMLLKIKLDGDTPLERLKAIRDARPDARLVVDANEGWDFAQLQALAPACAELGVEMIEQPLPRGADAVLAGYRSPVPLCADESCLHLGELEHAASRYQMINIKLDKTGGLTHALELLGAARSRGMGVMVGGMAGGSLAMAPAITLGWACDLADVDGPLLQKYDRLDGIEYCNGWVSEFSPSLWG